MQPEKRKNPQNFESTRDVLGDMTTPASQEPIAVVWLRRDLRLHDNTALYHALRSGLRVLLLFVFDKDILDKLEDTDDARVTFLVQVVADLKKAVADFRSDLCVYHDTPIRAWEQVVTDFRVKAVYYNHDYEPYARTRDQAVHTLLSSKGIEVFSFKDQCLFEKEEVLSKEGKPYTVFTPYSRAWRARMEQQPIMELDTKPHLSQLLHVGGLPMPGLAEMGFKVSTIPIPPATVSDALLRDYAEKRNYPALPATSRLGIHLRFGTLSIRSLALRALAAYSEVWLNELIWRDFYFQILWHHPHVASRGFRAAYDHITWRNNEKEFEAWCSGHTGYPIVDAGMRELNQTGFMHNRVRMITASFLTKHLLIDWRWGEAYFARRLLDFDLSANNGGWQWAAGSGTDAAPYFRIFNPTEQAKKFDPQGKYILKWVPEWNTLHYTPPIVEHTFARKRCLETYKAALG
jgi:deoxyribodipyrimidine photo-lyase